MKSREKILDRLRSVQPETKVNTLPISKDEQLFADYPGYSSTLLELFKQRFSDLNGELYLPDSPNDARKLLQELLQNNQPGIAQDTPRVKELLSDFPDKLVFYPGPQISAPAFAEYKVGISVADCLVARTGSIVLNTRIAGGRRLSVLPPLHIVIARTEQLVPSLLEAIEFYRKSEMDWSYAVIITGPSRTSDIEKQLVLGAHGPKRLVLILLPDTRSSINSG